MTPFLLNTNIIKKRTEIWIKCRKAVQKAALRKVPSTQVAEVFLKLKQYSRYHCIRNLKSMLRLWNICILTSTWILSAQQCSPLNKGLIFQKLILLSLCKPKCFLNSAELKHPAELFPQLIDKESEAQGC